MKAITFKGEWGKSLLSQKDLQRFVGKKVIVTLIELEEVSSPSEREWKLLGSTDLGGSMDEVNLRDFAHD